MIVHVTNETVGNGDGERPQHTQVLVDTIVNYFTASQANKREETLETIPELVKRCEEVFSTLGNSLETWYDASDIFNALTGLFEQLTERGNTAEANLLLELISDNMETLFRSGMALEDTGINNLVTLVSFVIPENNLPISKEHWVFITGLMDQFAQSELVARPYLSNTLYQENGEILGFDLFLLQLLAKDKAELKYSSFIIELLKVRYGFKYEVGLHADEIETQRRQYYRNEGEAVEILRIWQNCDGRNAKIVIHEGETEKEDVSRVPSRSEVNIRKVQKIRRYIQVLEILKRQDALKVARNLYRTNGIANYNRYTLETLGEQYALLMRPSITVTNPRITCLSILPYTDHNGAFEEVHTIINKSYSPLEEVIIEAGNAKQALLHTLRATKGTASRQKDHRHIYHTPYDYILLQGHSDTLHVNLGNKSAVKGIKASSLDLELVQNPEFFDLLRRHNLIDAETFVVIKGCNAGADMEDAPAGYNLATLIKRHLRVADVIAGSTKVYSDQQMVIKQDYKPTLTQTKGRKKATIVSVVEQQVQANKDLYF
ncbi:MAG: hypothetical protein RLY61_752 [Candidatus Parcubacteria bacterium]|jgi:hypothetical protein